MIKNLDLVKNIVKPGKIFLFSFVILILAIQWSGFINPNQANITRHNILIDSVNADLFQVNDEQGFPLYYYREIEQYPCDDNVCYIMELKIYWDIWGNFLRIETEKGKDLTKIGHQAFSEKDYKRLHKQLNNPKSGIQYYKLKDLTEEESEDEYYSLDAISGATINAENITYESVKGAVKTCFTLWHIVHGETTEIIKSKTKELLSRTDTTLNIDQENKSQIIQDMRTLANTNYNPDISFIEHSIQDIDEQNLRYTFCLLEIMRRNEYIKTKQLDLLSEKITNNHSYSEIAIYNYLTQRGYNKKIVRNYSLYGE